jgi:hypothetical protein
MIIDCDTCVMRDVSCADCVITALLGVRAGSVDLDGAECDALGALASSGLVPPLRLVPAFREAGLAGVARRDGRASDELAG